MENSTQLLHRSHLLFALNSKTTNSIFFNSHNSLHTTNNLNPLFSTSVIHSSSLSSSSIVTRVTTAPVEYAPPPPDFDFHKQIARLRLLRSKLFTAKTHKEKFRVIEADSKVKQFGDFSRVLESLKLDEYELFLLKCVVAAGQEHVLVSSVCVPDSIESEFKSARTLLKGVLYALVEMIEKSDGSGHEFGHKVNARLADEEIRALRSLLRNLREIEQFYDCIGGIIGYQLTVLELLAESTHEGNPLNWMPHINQSDGTQFLEIHSPNVLDLSEDTEYGSQAALWGIEGLPDLGEIYPLGGAADRLGFVDPNTKDCLPAAMLPYCGRTLLEGLIRDLQAREFLYFKLNGKQCITPVAIMTSSAKNNHKHITSLCEKLEWFGRGRSSFKLFEQPLVPAVSAEDGQWLVSSPFIPVCKPGGHGAIWKLAYDKGVFKYFNDHRRKGATVRQVSNVVAATDLTLLALAGIGLRHKKKLGFASCKRNSGATEGVNVLIEKKKYNGNWEYGLSCIEYTEFDKYGITDGSLSDNRLQEEYPANTNILYVDLASAELIGSSKNETSLPGMVLNIKKAITYYDQFGIRNCVSGGRLECTMQNIADNFVNTFSSRGHESVEDVLDTFIVYNERKKVTSSAKKKRRPADKSLHQTPDGSLLDIIRNAYDLLSSCNIKLPQIGSNDRYADSGPPYLIFLHPALGPLWEVTRQKFSEGSISEGSELQIEVAEFSWRNVQLDGSLMVLADNTMGSTRINENDEPILHYGHRCGRCKLENINVVNKGINWNSDNNIYWKHDVQRFEAVKVILHGNAEFEASGVTLQGSHLFEVPNGHRMKVTSGKSGIEVELKPIEDRFMDTGSWYWKYQIKNAHVRLELVNL